MRVVPGEALIKKNFHAAFEGVDSLIFEVFKKLNNLIFSNRGKTIQEFFDCLIPFDIIEEVLDWDSGTLKSGGSPHDFFIDMDYT